MGESSGTVTLERVKTGIRGMDQVANGGFTKNRATLVTGTSGSAKTVLAVQFLVGGITEYGEHGVFVTCEETADEIRRNALGLGWDIATWEAEGKFAIIDISPRLTENRIEAGEFDFGGLMVRIESAVRRIGAKRVSMDSIGALFGQFSDSSTVRREMFRVARGLKELEVTSVITAERIQEDGDLSRYGVEEFVSDNVIVLRYALMEQQRHRTMEILKMRGASHRQGEWSFTVIPGAGLVILPLAGMELTQRSSDIRVSSGISELDTICGGGFFRDSIILVSGATGTGKTLMVTHFVDAASKMPNERAMILAFEESREQLFRNAAGWGVDFAKMEREGNLSVVCEYPENRGLEDHLVRITEAIEEHKPTRLAVDSVSALERVASIKAFREFVIGLTSMIKEKEITGLFTATTPTLMGGTSVTEAHISTITDSIILLRYVEMFGEMRRGITVLKMRGSAHEKDIREFQIDNTGMHLGNPFRNVVGILAGQPVHVPPGEVDRLGEMFQPGKGSADGLVS